MTIFNCLQIALARMRLLSLLIWIPLAFLIIEGDECFAHEVRPQDVRSSNIPSLSLMDVDISSIPSGGITPSSAVKLLTSASKRESPQSSLGLLVSPFMIVPRNQSFDDYFDKSLSNSLKHTFSISAGRIQVPPLGMGGASLTSIGVRVGIVPTRPGAKSLRRLNAIKQGLSSVGGYIPNSERFIDQQIVRRELARKEINFRLLRLDKCKSTSFDDSTCELQIRNAETADQRWAREEGRQEPHYENIDLAIDGSKSQKDRLDKEIITLREVSKEHHSLEVEPFKTEGDVFDFYFGTARSDDNFLSKYSPNRIGYMQVMGHRYDGEGFYLAEWVGMMRFLRTTNLPVSETVADIGMKCSWQLHRMSLSGEFVARLGSRLSRFRAFGIAEFDLGKGMFLSLSGGKNFAAINQYREMPTANVSVSFSDFPTSIDTSFLGADGLTNSAWFN